MAAPRAEIPIVVLSESTPISYVAGATVYIKIRSTETAAKVFVNSGASEAEITQPLSSDSLGRITGWLERGAYKCEITIPGKSAYTEYLDIVPGVNGSVTSEFIAAEAITLEKMAAETKNAAAGTASMRSLGTTATTAAAGNDSRLSNERTPANGSVTTEKIANNAVTAAKVTIGILPPTGCILAWPTATAPTGYVMCNGASYAKTAQEPLWQVIEYKYGGSGANFNVPDLRGRTVFMADGGAGRLDNSIAPATLAASGGNMWLQSHLHTAGTLSTSSQIWQPQQTIPENANFGWGGAPGFTAVSGWAAASNSIAGSVASTGAGSSQNMPPYLILNYVIKT